MMGRIKYSVYYKQAKKALVMSSFHHFDLPVSGAFLLATHSAHCFHQCQFIICVSSLKATSIQVQTQREIKNNLVS